MNKLIRAVLAVGYFLLVADSCDRTCLRPNSRAPLKTRNVVLIVSDGLRWQEIFSGADPSLMDSEHGGIWADPKELKQEVLA